MKKTLLIFLLAIILGSLNITFAQELPNDWDIRTITKTWAISRMDDWCDPYWSYAFYEWSDVYFLLFSEQLKNDNYWIFKTSNARKYWEIFSDGLKFPFNSIIQPKRGTENTPSNKIIITKAIWSKFTIPENYDTARNKIAWQLVTNNEYRLLRSTNPMKSYFFMNSLEKKITIQASANFSPNASWKKACASYYVARCWDGIIDKATGDKATDGQWWMATIEDEFLAWHETSIKPNEVCDDWALNWQAGKCKIDCSGIDDGWETGNMIVTKTLTIQQNYTPWQELQFRIDFSNPTSQNLENTQIEDFLPAGLEYISSEINWVSDSLFSTGNIWWSFRIAYTWFSLNAGKKWHILINVKLLACNSTLNLVNRSAISNWQTISWTASKKVDCITTPVSISKLATPNSIQWWQKVKFTLTATNATPNTITNVDVNDVWPNCFSFVEWSATMNMEATQTSNVNLTKWTLANGLAPWKSFIINFDWLASNSSNCVGTHTNTWIIIFTDDSWTNETKTNTNVTISKTNYNVSIKKTITQQGFWPGDYVVYEIRYRNNWATAIASFTIKDYRPIWLEFIESTPSPDSIVSPYLQTPIVWNITTPLQPNEERVISINGRIKTNLQ